MTKPEFQPAAYFAGRWLRSRSNPEWGMGFCKGRRGDRYVLAYADIPDVVQREELVAPADLIDKPIPKGTRVWVPGTEYGWHAGEIKAEGTLGRYRVALVGVPQEFLLYQYQFVVRWSCPLADPIVAIQHGLCEAPVFHEARSELLASMVRQRQVSRGLPGVVSAPVSLYHHQLDTVARVLADPVLRYLLADEVGLGKTIEAGLVIRQVMLDDPDANVRVLVPDSLVGQWRDELSGRLALGPVIEDGRLLIMSHELITPGWNLDHVTLVVIDEAHNALDKIIDGSITHRALVDVPALLALSATPMRGDLGVFRRLLALVDPIAFGATSQASFLQRLTERERSARDLQLLGSRRASVRQKRGVIDRLRELHPDDSNIDHLASACVGVEDNLAQAWTDLAEYIRETYRLSRRMIRHRRNGDLTDGYAVAGRKPTYVEIHDPARTEADEFLDLLRFELEAGRHEALYAQAVLHALAGPQVLAGFLRRRATLPPHSAQAPPDSVRSLFDLSAARLEIAGLGARMDAAIVIVQERLSRACKVVVSSSFTAIAKEFEERLCDAVEEVNEIFRHYADMRASVRDDAVADFLSAGSGAVLVADRSMEEGRNLQEAEVLINLDLPLDASRLDQRIGRLDRYAVRPEPAEVVVFTEPSSRWVTAQIRLLGEGTGVFDSSVSTVQRMLTVLLETVRGDLLARGVDALDLDVTTLREELDTERDDIELLEEMESVSAAVSFGHEAFAELLEYENGDDEPLRRAVKRLTQGTGSLGIRPVESKDGVIRFEGAKEIGLPEDKIPALLSLLRAPKTYSRQVAADRYAVAPFRIGDPLVDWLDEYLRVDERGRAYAVVRPVAGLTTPALWLHCEFLVEFDDLHLTWDGAAQRRLARRGDGLFPPVTYKTWTDPYGAAPEDLVRETLDLPFDSKRDEVLRGPIWKPVLEEFPAWVELVKQSADQARALVIDSPSLAGRVERGLYAAHEETRRRDSILRARSLRLPTEYEREAAQIEFESEKAAGAALVAGIEKQSIQMSSCGVCVLWPEDNF